MGERKILLPGVYGIEVVVDGKGGGTITSKLRGEVGKKYSDAAESIILAHACAGVDIEDPKYLEGIETAVEAMGNHG